jgi:hypothetical protein
MHPRAHNRPSLFAALLGTTADPRGAMERLLNRERHPLLVVIALFAFMFVIIVPPLLHHSKYSADQQIDDFFSSVAITTLATLLCTSVLLASSMHVAGVRTNYLRAIVALAFCSVPITAVLSALITGGRLYAGSFTITSYLATGITVPGDLILEIFPAVVRASLVLSYITLAYGLSTVARSSFGMGLIMATLTIPLLLGSFIVGLSITELVHPQTSSRTIEFFSRYLAYPRS